MAEEIMISFTRLENTQITPYYSQKRIQNMINSYLYSRPTSQFSKPEGVSES